MKLSKINKAKLNKIVLATQSDANFAFMSEEMAKPLVDAALVECNIGMTNPNNDKEVATRATQKGIDLINGDAKPQENEPMTDTTTTTAPAEAPTETAAPAFAIEHAPMPARTRVRARTSRYPFAQMEVGDRFFVPATDEMDNPAKTLASTVSSTTRSYATENGTRTMNRRPLLKNEDGSPKLDDAGNQMKGELAPVEVKAYTVVRKFVIAPGENAEGVKGAYIGRVAVAEGEAAE